MLIFRKKTPQQNSNNSRTENDEIWPREYVKRRIRYAEAMWEIAYKHESYLGTETVLDELLEILRLDYFDHFNASHMAVFMFLYLGNQQIV